MKRVPHRDRLSQQAYRELRSAILARRFDPGAKLVVRTLAEQLELSPTPVKEALTTLAKEGLVRSISHRGFFVAALDAGDVEEIFDIRELLEGLAVGLVAPRATPELVSRLSALIDRQTLVGREGDYERYGDLDMTFHRLIWQESGNGRLLEIAESLTGQVRLLISTSAKVPGRLERSLGEHRRIVHSIAERDAGGAREVMKEHVRNAGRALYDFVDRDPSA